MRLPVCIVAVLLLTVLLLPFSTAQASQWPFGKDKQTPVKLAVKIINRQSSETEYSYQVPGYFRSTSNGNANCYGNSMTNINGYSMTNINCSASSATNGSFALPTDVSYSVTGATLSLLLPDGRIVVVNCSGKVGGVSPVSNGTVTGLLHRNFRSCGTPLVDDIQAEFKGDKAKLEWAASVDGKKFDSETYKILGILDNEAPAIREAAEQGLPVAQFALGAMYASGKGEPQNDGQAAVWLRKAAEQGLADAQFYLGVSYYLGKGVPQDDGRATAWWRKAADQDNAEAQWDLGLAYQNGRGAPQSNSEAYFWFDIAASSEANDKLQGTISKARDDAASRLTPADLSSVQERARGWFAEHPAKATAQ